MKIFKDEKDLEVEEYLREGSSQSKDTFVSVDYPMIKPKELKKTNWEEEYTRLIGHYGQLVSPNLDQTIFTSEGFKAIKQFTRQTIQSERQALVERVESWLESIHIESDGWNYAADKWYVDELLSELKSHIEKEK